MFVKLVFLASVAIASASLVDVDPNSLSCDPLGLVHLLLPSFDDCGKFLMCVHGQEVEFTCPGGLWFDFVLQGCNWPQATECTLRTKPDDSVEIEEGSGEGFEFENRIFNDDVALNCADASGVQLASHRDDCQRFWRCNNGVPETAFCSDGLYFNPKSLQCDFEANVICTRDAHEEIGEEFLRY